MSSLRSCATCRCRPSPRLRARARDKPPHQLGLFVHLDHAAEKGPCVVPGDSPLALADLVEQGGWITQAV